MKLALAACVLVLALSACAGEFVRVGSLAPAQPLSAESKCELRPDEKAPQGFTITALQAIEALPMKYSICKGKVTVPVFADQDNYYFLRALPRLLPPSSKDIEEGSFVVNGRSGALVRTPKGFGA